MSMHLRQFLFIQNYNHQSINHIQSITHTTRNFLVLFSREFRALYFWNLMYFWQFLYFKHVYKEICIFFAPSLIPFSKTRDPYKKSLMYSIKIRFFSYGGCTESVNKYNYYCNQQIARAVVLYAEMTLSCRAALNA